MGCNDLEPFSATILLLSKRQLQSIHSRRIRSQEELGHKLNAAEVKLLNTFLHLVSSRLIKPFYRLQQQLVIGLCVNSRNAHVGMSKKVLNN